jgi:hypothetical protein
LSAEVPFILTLSPQTGARVRVRALCGFGFEAGIGQFFEAARIVDGLVAEVFEGLAAQCGAAAGAAVDEDGFVLLKRRIVEWALGIGPEFLHAA